MRELLIATTNEGKLPEMLEALGEIPFNIVTLADLSAGEEVEEPGSTLEGNAIIKAMTYGKRTGLLTLAEDTGLEVDALPGKLGTFTKRYGSSDEERNQKLLKEMENVPEERRIARFRTVAAIYDPKDDRIRIRDGECPGRILREYRGDKSFGFGPIFFADELGATLSEVDTNLRNSVSHRGKALARARAVLLAEFA